jgi:Protein of unknown function (DUF3572)
MLLARAAEIGQDALIWLASRPEALAAFLAAGGLAPEALRGRAGDPEFLGFVLDFLLGADAMVLDFAAEAGLRPEDVARARAALPGGELPNWT